MDTQAKGKKKRLAKSDEEKQLEYQAKKADSAKRSRDVSMAGRSITIPPVVNQTRRDECRFSFKRFCEVYCSHLFTLEWSNDHLLAISRIEQAVLQGGLFALAMARGSGKSTLCECAALWAVLYSHRHFVAIIGADKEHAAQAVSSIKQEMTGNGLLVEDFPEVCYPYVALMGIGQKAKGQLHNGKPTQIVAADDELVLPTIAGSAASGSVVKALGLTGSIRGLKYKRADGVSIRPDLVLPDDPQTDESARSKSQCEYRESIISGAVLGLAGPEKRSLV